MKNIRAIIIAVAGVSLALPLRAELANGIKVVVHDAVVTKGEVEEFTGPAEEVLRRQYFRTRPDVYERKLIETLNENLELLLDRQLILHDFKDGGYNMPEAIIEEAVQEEIRNNYGGREKLTKTLQARGKTFEKFRQDLRERIIIRALQAKNIAQEIIVSPHRIESYYLAHKEDYKLDDEVKLRMIVLNKSDDTTGAFARKRAEEIRAKIKEGVPFSEMAQVNSEDAKRNEGGDRGWMERRQLRDELANVAFSLKPGEVSDPIEIGNAVYLMLVEDRRAAHIKSLNEVRDEVEEKLVTEERARLQKQWLERLRKKTFIRYF